MGPNMWDSGLNPSPGLSYLAAGFLKIWIFVENNCPQNGYKVGSLFGSYPPFKEVSSQWAPLYKDLENNPQEP